MVHGRRLAVLQVCSRSTHADSRKAGEIDWNLCIRVVVFSQGLTASAFPRGHGVVGLLALFPDCRRSCIMLVALLDGIRKYSHLLTGKVLILVVSVRAISVGVCSAQPGRRGSCSSLADLLARALQANR